MPSNDQPFLDAIAATSVQLSVAMDDEVERDEISMRHNALMLEKLMKESGERDDVISPDVEV